MSNYAVSQKVYPVSASIDTIPDSLGSSKLQKPIPSSIKTVAIVSSNGTQTQNGQLSFLIPTGAGQGVVKSGSMYLRGRCTVKGGTAQTTLWSFNGPMHSCANIIRNLTVFLGSQQIDQILNYGLTHDLLLAHTTSKNFIEGDGSIMFNSAIVKQQYPTLAVADDNYVDFCIPIISNLFNGEKYFPLYLLNSPVMLQFDLESLFNAITGSGATFTSFEVSNAQIVFDHIELDQSYKMAVKQALSEGNLYQMNLHQWLNSKVAKQAGNGQTSLTYNIGLNVSSCNGILWALAQDATAYTDNRVFKSGTINSTSDFAVYLDGQRIENQPLNNLPVIYAEMNKVFGNLLDPTQTFGGSNSVQATTLLAYSGDQNTGTGIFTGGVSFRRFNESMAMGGLPAQNLQFTLTNQSSNNDLVYYFVLYETILTIDATGSAVLIR